MSGVVFIANEFRFALAAILAAGIVAGAVGRRPSRSSAVLAFALAGLAALALAGADTLLWPEGRAGLILEITLMALGAFTLGAGIGVALRRMARRRSAPPQPLAAAPEAS